MHFQNAQYYSEGDIDRQLRFVQMPFGDDVEVIQDVSSHKAGSFTENHIVTHVSQIFILPVWNEL